MNKYFSIALFSIFLMISTSGLAQTQEEIQQMMNGNTTEETVKQKKKEKKKKIDKTIEEVETSVEEVEEKMEESSNDKENENEKKSESLEDVLEETEQATDKSNEKIENEVEESVEQKKKKSKDNKEAVVEISDELEPVIDDEFASWKGKKLMKAGDKEFERGNYLVATKYYQAALSKVKKSKKKTGLQYQIGESYFVLRDYQKASNYFYKVMVADKKQKYPIAVFQLANSYKYLAEYDSARSLYNAFRTNNEKNNKLEEEKQRARIEIKGCDFADTLNVQEPKYTVENSGNNVNSELADFGPEIRKNELIFTKVSKKDGKTQSKIYTSEMYNGKYNFAQIFGGKLNVENEFTGNQSFSKNGETVYFTRCATLNDGSSSCKIYQSKLINGKWSEGILLGEEVNLNETNSTQPHIFTNENGAEILYFVSERAGGKGGKDIWYSEKQEDGIFGRAKNIGYPINTQYDEVSPFYHSATKTLYFSSNGHISLGGFDVFKSELDENGDWLQEINLKMPVNTSLDDFDFVLNETGDFGFLTSNRIGTTISICETCSDDIFEVRATEIDIYLTGLVYVENNSTRQIANDANVVLISDNDLDRVSFSGEPFFFKVEKNKEYTIKVNSAVFESEEVKFSTANIIKSDTLNYDVFLKTRDFTDYLIGSIYYEFNSSKLTSSAPDTLNRVVTFMQSYPKLKVEVGSFTDSKGTDKYNLDLSEKRSVSAMNFLKSKGIDKERLSNRGYGEAQPKAPNLNADGTDNEAGRALNRRTEFRVVGEIE